MHRVVDGKNEVITASEATTGTINEAHLMLPLLERHEATTGIKVETVVADSKYGTIDNYLACNDRCINAHMPDMGKANSKRIAKLNIFQEDQFQYDPDSDTFRCPAGQTLKRKSLHIHRESSDYAAPKKVCAVCELREQCTRNKAGRTIKRHLRQDELNAMRYKSQSAEAKKDIKTRQHLMERSFANATRFGFDHARWRGLWRMRIQELLVCSVQNIQVLIKKTCKPKPVGAMAAKTLETTLSEQFSALYLCILCLMVAYCNRDLTFQRT